MMYRLGLWIAKHRIAVLIFAVILLIPAVLSYLMLHVNYDILYYLPDDIESCLQVVVDDGVNESASAGRIEAVKFFLYAFDEGVQAGEEPAVNLRAL